MGRCVSYPSPLQFIAAGAILSTLMFPPFVLETSAAALSMGYHFILSPPEYNDEATYRMDYLVLLTEWVGILAAYWLVTSRK